MKKIQLTTLVPIGATLAALLLGPAEYSMSAANPAPVPHGKMAYYNDFYQLRIADTVNQLTTTVPLPAGLSNANPQLSMDGQWVVFHAWQVPNQSQVYVVHPDGSGLRRMTDGTGNCVDPNLSPDGTRIAYQQVYGHLFLINFDGSGTTDTGVNLDLVKWSPDGKKILGENWGWTYQSDLFTYDVLTGQTNQITHHRPNEAFHLAAWSPDGSNIVCLHNTNLVSSGWRVCVMNSDGSNPVDLTADWASNQQSPNWSPDGRYLIFLSNQGGNYDIWAMWADGTGRTNVTQSAENKYGRPDIILGAPSVGGRIVHGVEPATNSLTVLDTIYHTNTLVTPLASYTVANPDWSPDGQWIAFQAWQPPGAGQIYVVHPDGSGLRRVTDGTGNCVDPDLSPDGTRIAYQHVNGHLFLINFNGSGTTDTGVNLDLVKWSPDGEKILGENWGWTYQSDLFTYDTGSGQTNQLTHRQPNEAFHLSNWSPDGTKIVCIHNTNIYTSNWRICVMNADGSNPTDLTADWTNNVGGAVWSPDGQYIVFLSNRSGNYDIWAMWPDGTGRTNVTQTTLNESTFDLLLLAPAIVAQPISQTVASGGTVTFSVGALGSGPLHYQWQFNGTNIAGANGPSLTLSGLTAGQVGNYTVVVSNWSGSVPSSPAVLSLLGINMFAGLTVIGPVGTQYSIQCKNDINQSFWATLTNITLTTGQYLWTDYSSPAYPKRFYRAVLVP
jgi:Tol biopolymer transport system component